VPENPGRKKEKKSTYELTYTEEKGGKGKAKPPPKKFPRGGRGGKEKIVKELLS